MEALQMPFTSGKLIVSLVSKSIQSATRRWAQQSGLIAETKHSRGAGWRAVRSYRRAHEGFSPPRDGCLPLCKRRTGLRGPGVPCMRVRRKTRGELRNLRAPGDT